MKLHVLASGSRGNATIVENDITGEGILIDCGICKRDVIEGAKSVGFDVRNLRSILITHDHSDHTKGLGVVLRALQKMDIYPDLFINEKVKAASKPIEDALSSCDRSFKKMDAGQAISTAGMLVHTFETSHDAANSVGFRIERTDGHHADAIGYMTDTGIVTPAAHEALKGVRILALESNHDTHMLKIGPYPFALKERVASDLGHLSNDQAASELICIAEEGGDTNLECVVGMHISQNNNTYRLPRETLGEVASSIRSDIKVLSAFQERIVSV